MTLRESRLHWSTSANATPHPDPSPTPTTRTAGDDEHLVHGQRNANEQLAIGAEPKHFDRHYG